MWKYQHSVKDNPKSGYDWSATEQWQTAFCVCQREYWEMSKTLCSVRKTIPKRISWDLLWNWHSWTDCTQNNLSRSPAKLCQTTSRTAAVWNQSRCPSDSLQAAAVRGTVWLHIVCGWKAFTVEPPFNSQNDRVTYYAPIDNKKKRYIDTSIRMSVMVSVAVSQVDITELIFVNPGVKVKGQYYCNVHCCLSRCFQQSNVSQNVVYSQNNMLLAVKLVIFVFCDFPR